MHIRFTFLPQHVIIYRSSSLNFKKLQGGSIMMDLKFLGRGGAFFTKEGNTSAYFVEGRKLVLIDCGGTVFSRLRQLELFESEEMIEEVYCFITHLHGDHVGSLSDLIFFCNYGYEDRQIKFHLVCPDDLWFDLSDLLRIEGVDRSLFDTPMPKDLSGKFRSFRSVDFIPTEHQNGQPAVSIEFETDDGYIFYSGDTGELDLIRNYIQNPSVIRRMYIEVTNRKSSPNNIHLSLNDLGDIIPRVIRDKVFLMHFNSLECINQARDLGFQIVECV